MSTTTSKYQEKSKKSYRGKKKTVTIDIRYANNTLLLLLLIHNLSSLHFGISIDLKQQTNKPSDAVAYVKTNPHRYILQNTTFLNRYNVSDKHW